MMSDQKIHMSGGFIVPDPADSHRWMIVGWVEETDSIVVYRRAEEVVLPDKKGVIDD